MFYLFFVLIDFDFILLWLLKLKHLLITWNKREYTHVELTYLLDTKDPWSLEKFGNSTCQERDIGRKWMNENENKIEKKKWPKKAGMFPFFSLTIFF